MRITEDTKRMAEILARASCLDTNTLAFKCEVQIIRPSEALEAMEEYANECVKAKCTIPVVSGSLPLASDEEIQKYVTERFSESHLLPEIIAFRAIKYYRQGMPPVSGRRCCLDESEGKQ
jgi:hypothetical protein